MLCFQLHYCCGTIQWSKTNDKWYIPGPAYLQQQGFRCSFWHNSPQHQTASTCTAADLTSNDRILSAQLAQCACAGLNRQWAMASGCRRKRILKRYRRFKVITFSWILPSTVYIKLENCLLMLVLRHYCTYRSYIILTILTASLNSTLTWNLEPPAIFPTFPSTPF